MANFSFDSSQVQPATLRTIPEGVYLAKIVESELKDTKNGAGKYLEFTFEIMKGEYAGRKIKSRLNVVNRNETAQQIAYEQLSAICHAINVISFTATEQLHNIPLDIVITNRTDEITGKTYADVSEYTSASELPKQPSMIPPENVPQLSQPVNAVPTQPVQQPVNVEPVPQPVQPNPVVNYDTQSQYVPQQPNPVAQPQPAQQPVNAEPVQQPVQQPQQAQPVAGGSTVPPWVSNGQ